MKSKQMNISLTSACSLAAMLLAWPAFAQPKTQPSPAPASPPSKTQVRTNQAPALSKTQAGTNETSSLLSTPQQKVSYSLGMNIGSNYKRQGIEVDASSLMQGLKDALSGTTPLLTEQEAREVISTFSKELRAKQEEKRKQMGEKAKKEGEAFLAENKNKPGVVSMPSGLQYKVLTEGQGVSPKSNDIVTVNYRGTLIDGTEFDSSHKRGQPATFAANGVIQGWTEALQLMKPGSKWQLYIPSQLAYKEFGRGAEIPPNATLNFEVELLSFKSAAAPTNEPITSDIIKVPSAEELKKGAKIEVIKPGQTDKK